MSGESNMYALRLAPSGALPRNNSRKGEPPSPKKRNQMTNKTRNKTNNEQHRCCAAPDASRNDIYADWDALMVPEGNALAGLACGKPAGFRIIDARTRQPLFWLCPEHKEEYRYAVDPVVGEGRLDEDSEPPSDWFDPRRWERE